LGFLGTRDFWEHGIFGDTGFLGSKGFLGTRDLWEHGIFGEQGIFGNTGFLGTRDLGEGIRIERFNNHRIKHCILGF